MNFATALDEASKVTHTENGALAYNTTDDALLDLYSTIGALRSADDVRIKRLFDCAYKTDPLFATRIVFYGRDIRGGLGERKTFRTLLKHMADNHPSAIKPNMHLVPEYGRWDDMYSFIGTPLEDDMWRLMNEQLEKDCFALADGKNVSLLAKWIKTPDASSKETRKLGILTAKKLGYTVYHFKRIIRALRRRINVTESLMSAKKWDEIKYEEVPSRASTLYRNAFSRHDGDRYREFATKAVNGEAKINSSTLYPYDIIERYTSYGWGLRVKPLDNTLEAQWKQLPDYIEKGSNAIVIADTSGSMHGRPINSAIGLAIYFAERNTGAYHNLWMSFSGMSTIHKLKGDTLQQKINSIDFSDWENDTNIEAAFDGILDIAVKKNVPADEMPKALVIVSDMEFNQCAYGFMYDSMAKKFAGHGYELPNVVFWNVDSRKDTYHIRSGQKGVQLISGSSTSAFKNLMDCVGMTPVEAMVKIINCDRYAPITIEE